MRESSLTSYSRTDKLVSDLDHSTVERTLTLASFLSIYHTNTAGAIL